MRTFTILVAAGALLAGVSIANAQGSQSQNAPVGAPNPTMSTVVGKSKFCVQTTAGTLSCLYASMNACQRASGVGSLGCIANPNIGTTGQR